MAKWVCTVCGYIYEGEQAPEKCPQCGVPAGRGNDLGSRARSWRC